MSDLEFGVRIKADASGLVGQLGAGEAANDRFASSADRASQSATRLSGASGRVGPAARAAGTALDEEGRAATEFERILTRLENRYDQAGASMRRHSQDIADLSRLRRAGVIDAEHEALLADRINQAHRRAGDGTRHHALAMREGERSARQQRHAYSQLGFQVQDITQQLSLGVNPLVVLAQQGGQTAYALEQMGGRGAGIARFFSGPWGSAIIAAATVVGMLTMRLLENEEATQLAERGSDGLAEAQSVLGEMFDLTSGKLQRQNDLLRLNAQLTALNLQAEAMQERQQARDVFTDLGDRGWGARWNVLSRGISEDRNPAEIRRLQQQADEYSRQIQNILALVGQGRVSSERALAMSGNINFDILDVTREDFQQAIINRVSAGMKDETARRILETLETNRLDPMFRRDRRDRREREDNRPQQAETSLERIQRINEQFDRQPRLIDRAAQSMRELDQILAEAQRRRLPRLDEMVRGAEQARDAIRDGVVREIREGFEEQPKLIDRATEALEALNAAAAQLGGDRSFLAQLEQARDIVVDSLNRPYRDFLEDQVRAYDIGRLIAEGREEEAEAIQVIHRLEQQLGPLSEDRKRVILESVIALRDQARELEIIRERQQAYLNAAQQVRGILTDAATDPPRSFRELLDIGSNISEAFRRLRAEVLIERLFGGVFRQIDDFVTGRDRVRQANEEMAASIGSARTEIDNLGSAQRAQVQSVEQVISATDRLTRSFEEAAARLSAPAPLPGSAAPAGAAVTRTMEQLLQPFLGDPISSGFGWRTHPITGRRSHHDGLDIPQPFGADVPAALSGRVSHAGPLGGYGNAIIVDHGNGLQTLYGHLSSIAVSLNQMIRRGQHIGDVGSTGQSTGNHLHYEMRRNGQAIDPRSIGLAQVEVTAETLDAATETAASGLRDLNEVVNSLAGDLPAAADGLRQAIGGAVDAAETGLRDLNAVVNSLTDDMAAAAAGVGQAGHEGEHGPGDASDDGEGIVVTGQRNDPMAHLNPQQFMERLLGDLVAEVFGERVGRIVGRYIVQAMEGAAFGQFGASLVLGRSGGGVGSQIGGAIGNVAGQALSGTLTSLFGKTIGGMAGPLGAIAVGILGGVLEKAITPAKRGSATITSVDGEISTRGNSSSFRSQASSVAGDIQEALQQIAEQLGGGVGGFSVSIGIRDGKFRVDPTGQGRTKTKKGAVDFGEDQAAAMSFAIADAILDGAVTGLSGAVQQALQSTTDINKALREALKVDELETLLAGTAGELNKVFKDLDRQHAERLRIARKYGFDVVKIEELNAKERAEAVEEILRNSVGQLQDLLDEMKFGDLFEGSIVDQREKLLVEIARAETDAKAGMEGAADRVADLRRRLLTLTRDNIGTAGPEYAADRASTISAAEEIIRLENERVKAAQDAVLATNQKLDQGNQLANEGNNIAAEQLAAIRELVSRMGGGGSAPSAVAFSTGRKVSL